MLLKEDAEGEMPQLNVILGGASRGCPNGLRLVVSGRGSDRLLQSCEGKEGNLLRDSLGLINLFFIAHSLFFLLSRLNYL